MKIINNMKIGYNMKIVKVGIKMWWGDSTGGIFPGGGWWANIWLGGGSPHTPSKENPELLFRKNGNQKTKRSAGCLSCCG